MSDTPHSFDPKNYKGVQYRSLTSRIVNIAMALPETRNAQDMAMTYALNSALDRAAHDDDVRVIILSGDGADFSAGHNLAGDKGRTWRDFPIVGTWAGFDGGPVAAVYGREKEIYLEMCERWRNIPKPTIAAVQGNCVAGGLMLAWACDIIVASENARFKDPTLEFGVAGAEFFMHPWELGTRKAKEWLMTSDWLSSHDAADCGMVNRVVPNDGLMKAALEIAEKIASKRDPFPVSAVKEAINFAQDTMGRKHAMMHAFGLHQLSHAQNTLRWGTMLDPAGMPKPIRDKYRQRYGLPIEEE